MRLTCTAILLLAARGAMGQFGAPGDEAGPPDSREHVRVAVRTAAGQVAQGGDLPVAVVLDIDRGWHVWSHTMQPGAGLTTYEFAILTAIETGTPSAGLSIHREWMAWPEIHGVAADLGDGPQTYGVFEGRAIAFVPVTVARDAPLGRATLPLRVTFQACDDRSCLAPATVDLTMAVEVVAPGTPSTGPPDPDLAAFPVDAFSRIRGGAKPPDVVHFDLFGVVNFSIDASTGAGFALLLLVAMLGGALLNFTPCVLPVIPLKIMGLSQAGHGSRLRTLTLGIAMACGVVGFWLGLGGLIAGFSAFTATNQLFQYPVFTVAVGLFIAFMAIAMCGLFSVRLPQFVYAVNPSHETHTGSFVFGIMAAILSTPCTAPFMGAAAAWAATKTPALVLITFAAIGSGMALPYLVLAASPRLIERMPRTGPASELIKQVMSLLMLAAAAYFVGVGLSGWMTKAPDPPGRMYWWAVSGFGIAAGAWLAHRTFRITRRPLRRLSWGGFGALIVLISASIGVRMTDSGPVAWTYYTAERFAAAKGQGDVVVMEFTAEWCLNCKALEESVLRSPRVVALLNGPGVEPIKVDLTGNNTAGNQMLREVQRLTIPLLVVFRPDGREVFKADFYTADQVLQAVERARSGSVE
jgi:thiol:disulfide interchange protein DsbD